VKISVITVCYNSAAHIADSLDSVQSQTWRDLEHVIVDGASTDETMSIIRSRPQPWRRVISEPDRGIYDAMNKGIALASGDVIGFINSDDVYASPHVLAKVAQVFNDKSVAACYGDLCYVKQNDVNSVVRYWRSSPFRPGSFARAWVPPHPTFFARRSVFERLGAFDLRYPLAADNELMARYMEVHRINTRYIPEVLVKMRLGGATNRSWAALVQQNREIWRSLKSHGLRPRFTSFAVSKFLSRGRQFLRTPDDQAG
jgi:glycosyltransferase involved in cell wall biosynthesis